MDEQGIAEVDAFLDSVEIDSNEDFAFESIEGGVAAIQPQFKDSEDQSVLVGSQISGFSADVPKELRPMLTNVFLLAQLVADKKSQEPNARQWHKHYFDTLKRVGWLKVAQSDAEQFISGTSVEVHREIIPVITAILGPAVAATSTVVALLKGLNAMSKDMPWITLFDQRSRRATSRPFQISQTIMEGGVPNVVLMAFELNAEKSVTQVLFFKFSSDEAKLSHYSESLTAGVEMLKTTEPKVTSIVADHIASNLAALDDLDL